MNRFETIRGAPAPWRVKAAAIAVALALASPAAAQRPAAKAATPAPTTSAPAPQRAPLAPAPVAAQPEADLPIDPSWRFGPALGLEFGVGGAEFDGVGIRLDAERELRRVSPEATLSFVGSLSMVHVSGDENVTLLVDPFTGRTVGGTIAWDANVLEAVPTARVTYRAAPAISFVADGGVGLVYTAARARPSPSLAAASPKDPVAAGAGGVVRLAGAIVITPSPGLRIAVEPLGLRLRFGNGPGSGFDLAFSIAHRL